jgi:hypothetical protein
MTTMHAPERRHSSIRLEPRELENSEACLAASPFPFPLSGGRGGGASLRARAGFGSFRRLAPPCQLQNDLDGRHRQLFGEQFRYPKSFRSQVCSLGRDYLQVVTPKFSQTLALSAFWGLGQKSAAGGIQTPDPRFRRHIPQSTTRGFR